MCHNLDNKVKFSLYSTRNIHTGDSKKCIRIRTEIFFRDATQRWRLYSTRQRRQRQCAGQQVCTKRSTPCAGFLLLLRAWPQAATQHVALLKVKLPAFWTKDTGSWFMLTESTFNRSRVVVSGLRFDLVLPALSEEAIEQVHGGWPGAPPIRGAPGAAPPDLDAEAHGSVLQADILCWAVCAICQTYNTALC